MNQINSWTNDTEIVNDKRYTKLIESILVERKSPLKRTLQLFCSKAHYKQEIDNSKLTAELETYFNHLKNENINIGYSYTTIEDIDFSYAEIIEQKIFNQEATEYEKIMIQKFYFKSQFNEEGYQTEITDENNENMNLLEYVWNNKFLFF
jgi:hypothetical protein